MSKHDQSYIEEFQPEQHHELGPSALKWIEICPGYRGESGTTIWAEEGTKLHKACEDEKFDGLDEEQMRMVARCLDYLAPLEKEADEVLKEQRLVIPLYEYDDSDES